MRNTIQEVGIEMTMSCSICWVAVIDGRGVARNVAMGGKNLDWKPHPLINAETGSNYYSVRAPANNTYFVKQ